MLNGNDCVVDKIKRDKIDKKKLTRSRINRLWFPIWVRIIFSTSSCWSGWIGSFSSTSESPLSSSPTRLATIPRMVPGRSLNQRNLWAALKRWKKYHEPGMGGWQYLWDEQTENLTSISVVKTTVVRISRQEQNNNTGNTIIYTKNRTIDRDNPSGSICFVGFRVTTWALAQATAQPFRLVSYAVRREARLEAWNIFTWRKWQCKHVKRIGKGCLLERMTKWGSLKCGYQRTARYWCEYLQAKDQRQP